jgi:hypothetical protein
MGYVCISSVNHHQRDMPSSARSTNTALPASRLSGGQYGAAGGPSPDRLNPDPPRGRAHLGGRLPGRCPRLASPGQGSTEASDRLRAANHVQACQMPSQSKWRYLHCLCPTDPDPNRHETSRTPSPAVSSTHPGRGWRSLAFPGGGDIRHLNTQGTRSNLWLPQTSPL